MAFSIRGCIFLALLYLLPVKSNAQNAPIGYWQAHLPYNSALGVATDGHIIYTICNQAFFTYNPAEGSEITYSKTDGMADAGMQCVSYDAATQTVVLVYANGNIDLFQNNTFYNIPDLKRRPGAELKQVYQVFTDNGYAYLCTTYGVVVVDLSTREIPTTYPFYINNENVPVYGFTRKGHYFYAATRSGLYRADKSNALLENIDQWQKVRAADTFLSIANVKDALYFSARKKLYTLVKDSVGDTIVAIYTAPRNIQHISGGNNDLFIGVADTFKKSSVKVMNMAHSIIDSFDSPDSTVQAVQLADNTTWIAIPKSGLKKRSSTNNMESIIPDGPTSTYSYDIYANNRNVYIAHGGYNGSFFASGSLDGFSNYHDSKWSFYKPGSYAPIGGMADISSIAIDESTGMLYAGSYLNGLFILNPDSTSETINRNPLFDGSIAYGNDYHQVVDLNIDKQGNLWVVLMFAEHQLYVKTPQGSWYKYRVPGMGYGGGQIAIDDSGLVWMVSPFGNGIGVYDTRKTLSDSSDDIGYKFTKGTGFGNLSSNKVWCIAKDKKNEIWAGSDDGMVVFRSCVDTAQNPQFCEAEIPYVNYNQYSGALFKGVTVRTIAVDATNRKWVGANNGLWLLSADAQQVIYHFTKDNSPLPTDNVQTISIDKVTGDVYVGTEQGLMCYHGTATEDDETKQDIITFPNPVPSGYNGTIAIRGLSANADVRITDINGQLVHRTKALGGQAVWDGHDYTGHRPQSGVYLFFVSDNDGKQTHTGKIVFIQ